MGIKEVRASHILVGTEEQAKKLMEKIKEGASFDQTAREYSKCPSGAKGGDLGWFKRQRMVREFENFCFGHKQGEMGIVRTQFGWHVIKVTGQR